jgi:hypothetical protein
LAVQPPTCRSYPTDGPTKSNRGSAEAANQSGFTKAHAQLFEKDNSYVEGEVQYLIAAGDDHVEHGFVARYLAYAAINCQLNDIKRANHKPLTSYARRSGNSRACNCATSTNTMQWFSSPL